MLKGECYLDSYKVHHKLGSGQSSTVHLLEDDTGVLSAGKVLFNTSPLARERNRSLLSQEARILQTLDSDKVVKLLAAKDSGTFKQGSSVQRCSYLVLELCEGGDLYDYVHDSGSFSEDLTRFYFKGILEAVAACHIAGIAHCDVKLDNILLDAQFNVKLADFGLATSIGMCQNDSIEDYRGTPLYMAPEIHSRKPYDGFSVDIFALGVCLFIMYTRTCPFKSASNTDDHYTLFLNDNRRYWQMYSQLTSLKIPPAFTDLVNSLLALDPSHRLSLAEIFAHPWMQGPTPKEVVPEMKTRKDSIENAKAERFLLESKQQAMLQRQTQAFRAAKKPQKTDYNDMVDDLLSELRDSLMAFAVAYVAHPELYPALRQFDESDLSRFERARVIGTEVSDHWKNLAKLNLEGQRNLMQQEARVYLRSLLDIAFNVQDSQKAVSSVLSMIDGALVDDRELIEHLIALYQHPRNPVDMVNGLKRLMINPMTEVVASASACHILSLLLSELVLRFGQNSTEVVQESQELVNWIVAAVTDGAFEVELAVYCLVPLSKVESLRFTFLDRGGVRAVLLPIFNTRSGVTQPIYSAIYCLWMISFNREALPIFTNPSHDLIRLIVRELRRTDKEKVIRVALGTFKNLSESNEEAVTQMVENKLVEVVESISKRVIKDPDVIELVQEVGVVLQSSIKLLSSYEKYLVELNKCQLVEGVTHTESFWKENARRFESDRFININRLASLLNSSDNTTVVIALQDLGEFARFHPFGKTILEKLSVKDKVMEMLSSPDKNVKEAALLCIQKLMIHNWQSLYS